MKKSHIYILFIIVVFGIAGGILYSNSLKNENVKILNNEISLETKQQLEPINNLIKTLYFKEGTYKNYRSAFTDPNNALKEKDFQDYKNSHSAKENFKYDSDTIDSIMKHMKIIEDKNMVKVYYLKDVNSNETKGAQYWEITKKDGKWRIKND